MKYHIYIILILLSVQSISAQEYEKDKKFIREVINHKGKMVVLDHLNQSTIQEIEDDIKSDTIQYNANHKGTLILTNAEQKYIHEQLKEMKNPYLNADLFDSTQIITWAQLDEIFKKGIGDGWEIFYNQYSRKGYYTFSKPIFLRHESLCVFYYGNSCGGLCGGGGLFIYKKTKTGWHLWIELFRWAS